MAKTTNPTPSANNAANGAQWGSCAELSAAQTGADRSKFIGQAVIKIVRMGDAPLRPLRNNIADLIRRR
jgi:hypothetical protein